MKLLCDVCTAAVASVVCCADEAALCSSCDTRVHAANKLAGKHHRVPLLSETPAQPALCDLCQEAPSFFFCVEDRSLLCRDCDVSVHSANALVAKHRRFLITGIKIGMNNTGNACQESTSEVALESPTPLPSTLQHIQYAKVAPPVQVTALPAGQPRNEDKAAERGLGWKPPSSPQTVSQAALASVPKSLSSYSITKAGTLSTASTISMNSDIDKAAALADGKPNSTRICIQRIAAGQGVPFVAPVLTSAHTAALRMEASNYSKDLNDSSSTPMNSGEHSNDLDVVANEDTSLPDRSDRTSSYLSSSIPGWRLDELLTDFIDACDNAQSLSPTKECHTAGLVLQDEQSWFSELDFLESNELSLSQEESVALVPEMFSPPTNSGLGTSHGKLASCPSSRQWVFDYLFTGPDNEFPVVPDVGKGSFRKSAIYSDPDAANEARKKRRRNAENA